MTARHSSPSLLLSITDDVRRSVVTAVLGLLFAAAPAAAATPVLPDLYEGTPYNLQVEAYGSGPDAVYHLGFGSTVYNFGRGPLRVDGRRADTSTPEMTATQVVTNTDGSTTEVPNVGTMRYVDSVTHRHWHYLRFNTYSLRLTDNSVARPDQKTGFCLGDRVVGHDNETLPGQPPEPVFTGGCGFDDPGLLEVSEGISPNYADPYEAQVEGQFVDVTDLPAGRYQLVHHVNENRALHETDYSNNAASVLVSVAWPNGQDAPPTVTQLASCDVSERCPVAPVLTRSKATTFAKSALRRARVPATGLRCPAPKKGNDTCTGKVKGRTVSVKIGYRVSRGDVYWTYSLRGHGVKGSGSVVVPFGKGETVPTKFARRARLAYCPLLRR